MTDAHAFLSAIMDMATGVLYRHGHFNEETESIHGPLDHIFVSGGLLDTPTREQLLNGSAPLRGGVVDSMFDNSEEGIFLAVGREGSDGYDLDIFVPLTASVGEAHALVKEALNEYVGLHFSDEL